SSSIASARTWRTDSFTLRIRSVMALVWQGRARDRSDDPRGGREKEGDDDAPPQGEEQDGGCGEHAELPALVQRAAERDGDADDRPDRRRPCSAEEGTRPRIAADAIESAPAGEDEEERRSERDERREERAADAVRGVPDRRDRLHHRPRSDLPERDRIEKLR